MPRRCDSRPVAGAFAAALALVVPHGAAHAAKGDLEISRTDRTNLVIATVLERGPEVPLPIRQRAEVLRSFYVGGNNPPLWIGTGRIAQLIDTLKNADRDGLDPKAYPIASLEKLAGRLRGTDEATRAVAELYFSAFFLQYAADLKAGRFLPSKIDKSLYWHAKKIDMAAALAQVARAGSMADFVEAWQPQIPEYRGLKRSLAHYRALAAAGGWPRVPLDEALKPGISGQSVPALRARLAVTDRSIGKPSAGAEEVYDDQLVAAVKRFQARHGLEPDGVVGKQTLFRLNIPVEDRIAQILVSMERWRWMPETLGRDYIMVNIAGFELKRVRAGKIAERMRVVVGKPYHQTPVFSERLKYVEINPYWNVPYSIATKEELPKLQKNPGARAARGFEAVVNGEPVPLTSIDWSQYSRGHFPIRIRQRPGEHNALGRVKFMFPNRFNVYMHDTPARALFGRAERAFSHGCIRLARPIDMTEQVLAPLPGWNRARIEQVLASKERTVVPLNEPLPVHLTYSTAWLDEGDSVHFRADIYRRDEKLRRALFGKQTSF